MPLRQGGKGAHPRMLAACMLGLLLVALLVQPLMAQNPLDMLMPEWQGGTEEEPILFNEWRGAFHDGSGPLGTYTNNQDSWVLISPCEAETAAGA